MAFRLYYQLSLHREREWDLNGLHTNIMTNNDGLQADQNTVESEATLMLTMIGTPRNAPYRAFFNCKQSDTATLGAYLWGQAIASGFLHCIGMYEVVLRNAIHRAASQHCSKGLSESYPWYDFTEDWVVRMNARTAEKVEFELYDNRQTPPLRRNVTPDGMVASLSAGFWPALMEGLNKPQTSAIFTDTFKNHPSNSRQYWSDKSNSQPIIKRLKRMQDMRNAAAHLEPIWKKHRLKGHEANYSQCLLSLRSEITSMHEIMTWCDKHYADAFFKSSARRMFWNFCSTTAVEAYMRDPFGAGQMQSFKQVVAPHVT